MNDDDTFTISYDDITVNLDSISNTGNYSITCDTNVSDITFSNTYMLACMVTPSTFMKTLRFMLTVPIMRVQMQQCLFKNTFNV